MKKKSTLTLVCGLIMAAAFVSCQDIADDSHYAPPSWLKGNAWEVLQKDGNYSSFLKAIELTGYKPIVNGQSIMTVFAADDNAWKSYLQGQGYSSVSDMYAQAPDDLKKTVAYHLMYYAYDWNKLINFRPTEGDGATDDEKSINAGMYYKHRTHSQDPMEQMSGKLNGRDTTVTLYHYERFLPVLSYKFFDTKGIDAAYNYQYFFPESQWNGGSKFNAANANVTDASANVTDNGYLYHVDQVIRPLETIYQTLKDNPNYSDFISLYDQYAEFTEAASETSDNVGKIVYTLTHGALPNIAMEWPITDFRKMKELSSEAYNIFAPSNQAIAKYFQSYWSKERGYEKIEDLDPLIMKYFIEQSFAKVNEPVFPEEIRNGLVETSFGTTINIDPDEVDDRLFCENGVVYGMNDMEAPALFSSVVGPAFQDSTYRFYLYTLEKAGQVNSYTSDKAEFVALIPTNEQFRHNDPIVRLNETITGNVLEVNGEDGFAEMGSGMAKEIVNNHIATNIGELKTSGVQVIQTNASFSYWYVRDGKITTNALFNNLLTPTYTDDPFVEFHEIQNEGHAWNNGRAYSYDKTELFQTSTGDQLERVLALGNDKNYEYYLFAQLLQKAGLTDTKNGVLPSLASADNRLIAFVPTNDAIKAHLSEIPGTAKLSIAANGTISGTPTSAQKTQLANYLRSYFISSENNTISAYPYPGSEFKGVFNSKRIDENGDPLAITVENDESSISIRLPEGELVAVSQKYSGLPFVFTDGCMQFLDGILK